MKRLMLIAVIAVALGAVPLIPAQHGHGAMAGPGAMGHGAGNASMGPASGKGGGHGAGKLPADMLTQNTKLSSKLQTLLPAGTTPQQACTGFKNLGQCVAAIHVSHNLGLSFTDLKDKMLGISTSGTTATKPMSLGKAIQTLAPTADAKAEAKKAKQQTDQDLKTTA